MHSGPDSGAETLALSVNLRSAVAAAGAVSFSVLRFFAVGRVSFVFLVRAAPARLGRLVSLVRASPARLGRLVCLVRASPRRQRLGLECGPPMARGRLAGRPQVEPGSKRAQKPGACT